MGTPALATCGAAGHRARGLCKQCIGNKRSCPACKESNGARRHRFTTCCARSRRTARVAVVYETGAWRLHGVQIVTQRHVHPQEPPARAQQQEPAPGTPACWSSGPIDYALALRAARRLARGSRARLLGYVLVLHTPWVFCALRVAQQRSVVPDNWALRSLLEVGSSGPEFLAHALRARAHTGRQLCRNI